MANPNQITEATKELLQRPGLEKLIAEAGNDVESARRAVVGMTQAYAEMGTAERVALIKALRADIKAQNPSVTPFNASVFVFQVIAKAEEEKDGIAANDFKSFSEFTQNRDPNHFHPDGLYGPRTKSVAFGNAAGSLSSLAEKGGDIKVPTFESLGGGKKKVNMNGTGVDGADSAETEAQRAARLAKEAQDQLDAENADKEKEGNRASKEDLEKYTFKRADVQYFEQVERENSNAQGLTADQLKKVSEGVRGYAFNEDGTLKTKNDDGLDRDYKNPTVQNQLRAAVREKAFESGVTDEQIDQLNFSVDKTRTRTIVGSFRAAENAMVNADNELSKKADQIKTHFEKPENKAYLEEQKVNIETIASLGNVREDQRGLYFKTNFVPPLEALAKKEEIEITKEYGIKIDNELAKLTKYDVLDKLVNIGYPQLVEVQKKNPDGSLMTKDDFKIAYDAQGREVRTPFKVPVMDEVKRPDEKALLPIEPNLNDVATKGALQAAGLIDENGSFKTLSYTAMEDNKPTQKTVSADEALKDPKKYNSAIKGALDTTYAFTDEEKKVNKYGGANLDKNIVKAKISTLKAEEEKAVAAEVTRLEGERDVKIENSPSNVVLKEAFNRDDSAKIQEGKAATSTLGKYEEANRFYKLASDYETNRQIAELTGNGVDGRERTALRKQGDVIEAAHKVRITASEKEVKGLEKALLTEKDEAAKAALQSKLESAQTALGALKEIPKNFDQRDKVQMISVNIGNGDLIHVDAATKKELQQKQAEVKAALDAEKDAAKEAAKAEEKAAKEAAKAAKAEEAPKADVATKVAETVVAATPAAVATPAVAPVVEAVADAVAPKSKGTVELSDEVIGLLAQIRIDAVELQAPAAALGNNFADQKAAKADWGKAVNALEKDLKALKALNKKDVDEGTDFDIGMEDTIAKVKELGVVVTDKFKIDETQTIQNLKTKSESQQR